MGLESRIVIIIRRRAHRVRLDLVQSNAFVAQKLEVGLSNARDLYPHSSFFQVDPECVYSSQEKPKHEEEDRKSSFCSTHLNRKYTTYPN